MKKIEKLIGLEKEYKTIKIEEFIEASNTIENWLKEIYNSFIDERFSNGYTEGINNESNKWVRFVYKNFEFLG